MRKPRPLLALTAALFALYAASAFGFQKGVSGPWLAGAASGDEPHYLVMAHSLIEDFDLLLGDDYAAPPQNLSRGVHLSHFVLDHHSYLWDPATGERILWSRVYELRPPPDDPAAYDRYRVVLRADAEDVLQGRDPQSFREIPLHPPGYAILLALAGAPLLTIDAPFAEAWLLALQLALYAFALARLASLIPGPAGLRQDFGSDSGPDSSQGSSLRLASIALVAAAGAAHPALFYSFTFYSEGIAASLFLLAAVSLVRREAARLGLCLGLLLFLKEVNGPAALVLGLAWLATWSLPDLQRNRGRVLRELALAGAPALAALGFHLIRAWLLYARYRTYIPWESQTDWLHALQAFLIGPELGLLAYTPALLLTLPGLAWMLAGRAPLRASRSLAIAVLAVCAVQFTVAVANAHGPAGPTFAYRALVPHTALLLLPGLLLPGILLQAQALHKNRPAFRRIALGLALLLLAVAVTNVMHALTHRTRAHATAPCLYPFNPLQSHCLR